MRTEGGGRDQSTFGDEHPKEVNQEVIESGMSGKGKGKHEIKGEL